MFLDRLCLCGGLIYVLRSPTWALLGSARGMPFSETERMWLNAAALGKAGEDCIPGRPAFSQGRHWRPLAPPEPTCSNPWWGGMCQLRSFLYPPYSKGEDACLVLSERSWALPPSLGRRSTQLSFTLRDCLVPCCLLSPTVFFPLRC